jgi:hypothetical protein
MRFNYPESVRSLVEDEAKNCTRGQVALDLRLWVMLVIP